MNNKIKDLQKQISDLEIEIWNEARKYYPDFNACWNVIGTFWSCEKSPFDRCLYDNIKDSAHDNCLFCGQPEERK